jgi:hypothetical protein
LTRGSASLLKIREMLWIVGIDAHALIPAVGKRDQTCVKGRAQLFQQRRQRVGEVAVLSVTKSMSRHDDSVAESGVLIIQSGDRATLDGG